MCFTTGQPLGYYGSWPLFAFTHHLLVWWCAEQVKPGIRFDRYAVLGDDVLSTDPAVAEHYRASLKRLGVSEHKSLISSTGSVEFAKRFLVKGMQIDLSPVSMKSVLGFHHPYGLMAIHEKYDLKRFSTFVRIGGGGYRTLSNLNNIKSSKWRRLKLMWDKRRLPLEYLLGSGVPLNPYLHGELVRLLRRKMAPKDLVTPPLRLFEFEGQSDFLECRDLNHMILIYDRAIPCAMFISFSGMLHPGLPI